MKYIIDIDLDDYFVNDEGEQLYRVKGFNSLVFDKNGLDKLEKAKDDKIDSLVYGLQSLLKRIEEKDKLDALIGVENPDSLLNQYRESKKIEVDEKSTYDRDKILISLKYIYSKVALIRESITVDRISEELQNILKCIDRTIKEL